MPFAPARSATSSPAVSRHRLLCSKFPKDPTHPLHIALRTYILSSFLSVVPSLLPLILSFASPGGKRTFLPENIKAALRRDLGLNGISFAMTAAVAGGAALQHVWRIAEGSDDWSADFAPITACRNALLSLIPEPLRHRVRRLIPKLSLSEWHKTFMSNLLTSIVAIHLLHRGSKIKSPTKSISASGDMPIPFTVPIPTRIISPTLDLTLLLLVRALDSFVQSEIRGAADKAKPVERVERHNVSKNSTTPEGDQRGLAVEGHQKFRSRIDAFIFWACSARSDPVALILLSLTFTLGSCGAFSTSRIGALRLRHYIQVPERCSSWSDCRNRILNGTASCEGSLPIAQRSLQDSCLSQHRPSPPRSCSGHQEPEMVLHQGIAN
jgi:hypothetical protein